jgi:NodT family efflux transporter outer membrane factor (OMF) lipoprotein
MTLAAQPPVIGAVYGIAACSPIRLPYAGLAPRIGNLAWMGSGRALRRGTDNEMIADERRPVYPNWGRRRLALLNGGATMRRLMSLAGAAVLGGCAVGPNFHRPAPPAVDRYMAPTTPPPLSGAGDQRFLPGGAVAAQWWTLFGSPELNALEAEALKANADLQAAEAALRQARELYLSQRASFWPTVDLAASGAAAKNSLTIAPPLADNAQYYGLYQGQLNLAYAVDVFGGLHRQVEAAGAQADNQRYQAEAAYLTLTTNVAAAALQLSGLDDQLQATEQFIAADRRTLALTRDQLRLGQAATTDVAAAETALEQAEQLAPPLRKQIGQARDLLAVLLGRPSAQSPAETFHLAQFQLPRDLPISLPSDLVRQRPDVLAAEANLHAASAQVGVAVAARLPSFTLNASAGGASSQVASLLSTRNTDWSISGNIAQTVFDAGALRHKQKAAQAAFDQARAQYRSTALGALQNVADVLQAIDHDSNADRHAVAAQTSTGRSLTLTKQQFQHGEVGALAVLTAEASDAQAQVTLAQTRQARYADTVALFQALGGGWWNDLQRRADVGR